METSAQSKTAAPALDLDQLMEKIRSEVADRKQLSGAVSTSELAQIPVADFATRRWSARELLALPATDFVRATHLAFFGREPSPEEFVRLRDRLLVNRVGRMRILREFRRSGEARARRSQIDGLMHQFIWDRVYWSPPAKFGRFVGHAARNLWLLPRHIRAFIARVETLERRAAEITAGLRNLQSAQAADRQKASNHIGRFQEALENNRKSAATRIEGVEHRTADRLASIAKSLASAESRLALAETKLVDHWRGIVDHKLGLESLTTAVRSASSSLADGDRLADRVAQESSHLLDPLYLSFEDRYRGTRADIKERQRVYLPRVEACYAAAGQAPVIDIGCGRGEWLELLSEADIAARGCDLNRIAVQECEERGLQAMVADGLETLAAMPGESCSAVTAFHIIEHLPFESVVKLLDQALRVLRRGGVLLLETPNPANLIVAAERFYLDPTHRNPLPSELTAYLLESRGFEAVEILTLHPVQADSPQTYADPMLILLQQKLFGPQDYGAIGRKNA